MTWKQAENMSDGELPDRNLNYNDLLNDGAEAYPQLTEPCSIFLLLKVTRMRR